MSTQQERLAEIADAIREKEGSTAPIPANEFAERIRALTIGAPPTELPDGYTQLQYIQTNYYTAISTNLPLTTDTTRIVMDIEPVQSDTSNSGRLVFVAYNTSSSLSKPPIIFIQAVQGTSELAFLSGLNSSDAVSIYSGYTLSNFERVKFDFDTLNKTLKINDSYVEFDPSSIVGSSMYLGNNGFFCFWKNTNTFGYGGGVIMKIYSAQIYINNDLFGNFVPCKNPSGEIGLYNTISKSFQGNVSTASASYSEPIAGPAV